MRAFNRLQIVVSFHQALFFEIGQSQNPTVFWNLSLWQGMTFFFMLLESSIHKNQYACAFFVFVKLHVCGEVDGFFTFLWIDNLVSLKKDPIDPDQMVMLILNVYHHSQTVMNCP